MSAQVPQPIKPALSEAEQAALDAQRAAIHAAAHLGLSAPNWLERTLKESRGT